MISQYMGKMPFWYSTVCQLVTVEQFKSFNMIAKMPKTATFCLFAIIFERLPDFTLNKTETNEF